MSKARLAAASCLLAIATLSAPAQAAEGATGLQLFYQNLTVARVNPLGFQNQFELSLRHGLFDPGDSQLLASNYIGVIVAPILTPGMARLGVALDIRPLNILKLEARAEYINWFGNFDLIQSYPDVTGDFSDSAIKRAGDAELNYATDGYQLTLDAELRAKVGPVIVRNRTKLAYVSMGLERGDTVFYDQFYDLLEPGSGWFLVNDADVLVSIGDHLIVGLRDSYGTVFYPDAALVAGKDPAGSSPTHRIGPLLAWRFFDEPGASYNQPTLLLIVNWYLTHRFRTGSDVSQALPYIVLGFAFNGDLL